MRRWLLVMLLLPISVRGATIEEEAEERIVQVLFKFKPSVCKEWNAKQWDSFMDELTSDPSGAVVMDFKLSTLRNYCPENMKSPAIQACLERTIGYSKQFDNSADGTFSAIMSDEKYLASQPPQATALPPELATSPNGLPKDWQKLFKKKGWKYVLFHSATGDAGRLVVHVPGGEYDRILVYAGYGWPLSNDPRTYKYFQMQAIEKRIGTAENPAKYYFRDWSFDEKTALPQASAHSRGGRCVSCHSSGPRAIVPILEPAFKTQLGGVKSLEQFNKLIVRTDRLDYSPYYDLKNFPQHLRVGDGKCARCHDGVTRNSLAFSVGTEGEFNFYEIHRKVVQEESMPDFDGDIFTPQDRENLAFFVRSDYTKKLKSWLTEKKCSVASSPTAVPASDASAKPKGSAQ